MAISNAQQTQHDIAQAYGTLATRLSTALATARRALEAHVQYVPGGTLAGLDTLLEEFARRRVRIALYGEVKAGKSTLLNAIAGAALSPMAFEPLTSVPIRLTYGPSTAWNIAGRRIESVAELERLMRAGTAGAHGDGMPAEVVVETPFDLLQLGGQVDLLDTPGVGSEEQFDVITAQTLRSLDAVVLVVRYPALFTQYTRQLVDRLEADIGKLFVVWNLDAACADLTPEERARHADGLRANVAGAHELHLVDARASLQAGQAHDVASRSANGLTAFTEALRRFVSSGGRELTAIREAAKRAQEWIGGAAQSLAQRRTILDRALVQARRRLDTVQADADAASAAARTRFAELEAAVARIEQQCAATAKQLEADVRRRLRSARRRWIRHGDLQELESSISDIISAYADAAHTASRATAEAVQMETDNFGTTVKSTPRLRTEPTVGPVAPDDRRDRAISGNAQLLRRALWPAWYLPGLTALEQTGLAEDLAAHEAWLNALGTSARSAAADTLSTRLSEISNHAAKQAEQIKAETNFSAMESEFAQLQQHLPTIETQRRAGADIATEARALLRS